MADEKGKEKYCFDTDTLASSWRRYYRPDTFDSLWERLASLLQADRIIIHEEVENEVGKGNDGLVAWVKKYNTNKAPISQEELDVVTAIVNKYPAVSQYKKPRPYHADPFVVAAAKACGYIVVTFEKNNGSQTNPSIPDLCKEYGVPCCTIADFFSKEGWQFNVK